MGDSIEISDKIDGVPIVTLRDLVVFPKTMEFFLTNKGRSDIIIPNNVEFCSVLFFANKETTAKKWRLSAESCCVIKRKGQKFLKKPPLFPIA